MDEVNNKKQTTTQLVSKTIETVNMEKVPLISSLFCAPSSTSYFVLLRSSLRILQVSGIAGWPHQSMVSAVACDTCDG